MHFLIKFFIVFFRFIFFSLLTLFFSNYSNKHTTIEQNKIKKMNEHNGKKIHFNQMKYNEFQIKRKKQINNIKIILIKKNEN